MDDTYAIIHILFILTPLAWFITWVITRGNLIVFFCWIGSILVYLTVFLYTYDVFSHNQLATQVIFYTQFFSMSLSGGLIINFLQQQSRARQTQEQYQSPQDSSEPEETTDFKKLNIYECSELNLANIPEIGPLRAKRIRQFITRGERFESFEQFAQLLNLREFERTRLQKVFDFSSESTPKDSKRPEPHGRVIDV